MKSEITVSLLGIQTDKSFHEFDTVKNFGNLTTMLDINPTITHHPVGLKDHFLSITITNLFVDGIYPKPLFTLVTQSMFSLKCDRILLDPPIKDDILGILSHLADMAIAHNQGILSISHLNTPLVGTKIYSNLQPRQVREMVRQKLNRKGN